MPDALLHSPLASLGLPANTDAVRLEERPGLGKLVLRGDSKDSGFRNAVEKVAGAGLPLPGSATGNGAVTLLWQGPDSWLVVSTPETVSTMADGLRSSLAGIHAAVTDVSSGTVVLRLAGQSARDLLYKGCFLDLDAPAFAAGHCAATRIAAFAVTIHQIDDEPAYDLYVARSMALAFGEWIFDAGYEYGLGRATG